MVEDKFAAFYFVQGKLGTQRSQWVNSLSDATAVSNLVLEADVLIALSLLEQASGHPGRRASVDVRYELLARVKTCSSYPARWAN